MTKTPVNEKINNSNEAMSKVDEILDTAKGKFHNVIVIGIDEKGVPDIISTINQYPFLHWYLNKVIFRLNLHETNSIGDVNES